VVAVAAAVTGLALLSGTGVVTGGEVGTASAASQGAQVGVPWEGEPGITETMAEILARERGGDARRAGTRVETAPLRTAGEPKRDLPTGGPSTSGGEPGRAAGRAPSPTTGVSFLATQFSQSGFIPPDTTGAVGPSQIVVPLNGRIKFFNKTGTQQFSVDLSTFFGSVLPGPPNDFAFDPRVEYDRLSGRWFVTAINGGADNRILIAVSSGPAITNATSFTFFQFVHSAVTSPGDEGEFADYPTLGVDANALYIGTNNFDTGYTSSSGFVVRKSDLLAGTLTVTGFPSLVDGSGGPFTPQGVENDEPGASEGYFIGVDNNAFGLLDVRRVTNPGGTPTLSGNLQVPVPSTSFPLDVPAQGSTDPLDSVDDRLFDAMIMRSPGGQLRLWAAHNIAVNSSGTGTPTGNRTASRWYEIGGLGGTPSLVQSGTLFDSGSNPDHYWMPSIAANGQGHALLASSVARPTRFASVALAQRFAGEAPGTLSAPVVAQAGAASYNLLDGSGRNRWGDYSQVTIDPNDNMTFWTFQEYANATDSWAVRVIEVPAPPPATPTSAPAVPPGQASVSVEVTGSSVNGSGFYDPGPGFPNRISAAVSGGVAVNGITFTDPTHVTLNLDTTGASLGQKDVTITNPDGQSATGTGVITVAEPVSQANRTITLDARKSKGKKGGRNPLLAVRKGGKVRFSGDVSAPQNVAGCESNQTVELQRKKPKGTGFTTFQQVQTNATGNFSVKKKIKKTFEYRAGLGETAACDDSSSNTEKVKAKKKKT
jgi:hypothetical protein